MGLDMKACFIFAGAPASPEEAAFLRGLDYEGAYIICADAGYERALAAGAVPDLVLGDFDNYTGPLPEGPEVLRVAAEKDDTDTMLAVKEAIRRGCDDITLLCALGGRFDHAYANLQALAYMLDHGVTGRLLGARERACMLRNGARLFPVWDGYLSVFAYTPVCTGVTLEGFRYPLTDATLTHSFPLGVSNEFAEREGRVTVRDGTLLIIQSKE